MKKNRRGHNLKGVNAMNSPELVAKKHRARQVTALDAHIGARLRQMREGYRMSMQELASRIGVSLTSLQGYELGKIHMSLARAYDICIVLDISVEDLVHNVSDDILKDSYAYRFGTRASPEEIDKPRFDDITLKMINFFVRIPNLEGKKAILRICRAFTLISRELTSPDKSDEHFH